MRGRKIRTGKKKLKKIFKIFKATKEAGQGLWEGQLGWTESKITKSVTKPGTGKDHVAARPYKASHSFPLNNGEFIVSLVWKLHC